MLSSKVNKLIYSVLILLVFCSILLQAQETPYKKVTHKLDPQAVCLDGSPGFLYINQGVQKDKFMIFFMASGICQGLTPNETLESCYKRSLTQEGSSKLWNDTMFFPLGYLSSDRETNKFANWTQVLFGYCDGALHQSSVNQPYEVNGSKVYFKGAAMVRSHFQWLIKEHNFQHARQVVLTGPSAGAAGSMLWSNYAMSLLKYPWSLTTIADSGSLVLFPAYQLNVNIAELGLRNLLLVANQDEKTPIKSCNEAFPGKQYKCFSLDNYHCYLSPRILLIDSQYDSYAAREILRIGCIVNGTAGETLVECSQEEIDYFQLYRKSYNDFITRFLRNPKNSAWTISCSRHTFSYINPLYNGILHRVPQNTGKSIKEAIDQFVFQGKRVLSIDQVAWPHNVPCAY